MQLDKEYEYCLRCGRKLKKKEARIKGYGSICEKKSKVVNNNRLFKLEVTDEI